MEVISDLYGFTLTIGIGGIGILLWETVKWIIRKIKQRKK